MRYLARIVHYGGNYSAMIPDLPGCVAAGDTVEEVYELIKEAASLHVDMMQRNGEDIPQPTKHVSFDQDEAEEGELCTWIDVRLPISSSI